ncbi:hypothetical protein B0J13DRAFT_524875 [Dactylonectria estremocensis]|uniref:Uncharacterized protein n=1 Tax=Dactylonectria estremocensis TaxID=1079267 RepID=A0A9P9EY77_9HYPO|nr:hypothetical protein B0J13DRAFT_524875 [Dactylonectria estremocensis]
MTGKIQRSPQYHLQTGTGHPARCLPAGNSLDSSVGPYDATGCLYGSHDGYFGSRIDISGGGGKCSLRCQGELSVPLWVRDLNNEFISHNRHIQFSPFPAAEMDGGIKVLDRMNASSPTIFAEDNALVFFFLSPMVSCFAVIISNVWWFLILGLPVSSRGNLCGTDRRARVNAVRRHVGELNGKNGPRF